MYKTDPILVEKCRALRRKGFTLGEIIKAVGLPKTTVYDQICDISLPAETKERIKREARKRTNEYIRKYRKGKCMFGRIVLKPKGWTPDLIFITAHFMFDGTIRYGGCVYQNRNLVLIDRVKDLVKKIFDLDPSSRIYYKETGVHRISYFYVELADYFRKKVVRLRQYITRASLKEKKLFLRAFFDDEGSVKRYRNQRLVRGYQHNLKTLKLIQKLLKDFDIESKIDEKYKEIVISRKPNLIKFRDKVNFSKGVKVNGRRKNSIWKKDLEKQKILEMIIASYKPVGTPGVHR